MQHNSTQADTASQGRLRSCLLTMLSGTLYRVTLVRADVSENVSSASSGVLRVIIIIIIIGTTTLCEPWPSSELFAFFPIVGLSGYSFFECLNSFFLG
jgi:hypothetical protein